MKQKLLEIQEYYENPAWSQSKLKRLLGIGKKEVDNGLFYAPKPYYTFGSAVDCKLLTPDLFDDMFIVMENPKRPTEIPASIIISAFENRIGDSMEENSELLAAIGQQYGYGKGSYTAERIIADMLKHSYFWTALLEAQGRGILTSTDMSDVERCVEAVKNHPVCGLIFDGMEIETQRPLYFDIDGLPCKALLDIIVQQQRVVDLKTTSHPNTEYAIKEYRYDIQLSYYSYALRQFKEEVKMPRIIFVDRAGNVNIFQLSERDMNIAMNGSDTYFLEMATGVPHISSRMEIYRNTPVKGWMDAIRIATGDADFEDTNKIKLTSIW